RDELRSRLRRDDAAELRLRRLDHEGRHDRPEPGGRRAGRDAGGRDAGEAALDGDDHDRPLHGPAAPASTAAPSASGAAPPDAPDMPVERRRVAVLMGGRSSEHDISLASARSVLEALDPTRYETTTIEIGRDGRWELESGSQDRSAAESLPVLANGRSAIALS